MRRKVIFLSTIFLLVAFAAMAQSYGVKKKAPKPYEFGTEIIKTSSKETTLTLPPAIFPHWAHRMKFTCRLCHVDIGFGMTSGETEITREDLQEGYYCGVCHDGKKAFSLCHEGDTNLEVDRCDSCHFKGNKRELRKHFQETVKGLPRSGFGNRVDWMAAEDNGQITLVDFMEKVSIKSKDIKKPVEFDVKTQEVEMPDIIFSHDKHTTWNGCEVCHPYIFAPKKGDTVYLMQDNFEGKYCGACHGKVAFPSYDCRQCHLKDVS